jgi:hypothetical protein
MAWALLIPLIGGAASALMFAAVSAGAPTALFLFYLSPLPLMVVALGWGSMSALMGATLAGLAIALYFGWPYFVGFMIAIGVPAWWSGHLALLARPRSDEARMVSGRQDRAVDRRLRRRHRHGRIAHARHR